MIKRISTLPSLSAVNTPLSGRPTDVTETSGISEFDLMELSVSGIPLNSYDSGGSEEGIFSSTGWASVKASVQQFLTKTYEYVMGKFLTDVDDSSGDFKATGEYMRIADPDGDTSKDRYIPLYEKL